MMNITEKYYVERLSFNGWSRYPGYYNDFISTKVTMKQHHSEYPDSVVRILKEKIETSECERTF